MISNFNIRHKQRIVKDKIHAISKKRSEVQMALGSLGINENQKRKQNPTFVDNEVLIFRRKLIAELKSLELEAIDLNKERVRLGDLLESERNKELMKIFREIMSQDQLIEIREESENRMEGGEPKALSFSFKRCEEFKKLHYQYRELAKEQLEKMIEFRILLTDVIDKGCTEFGNAEFLKIISPLNNLIIPLNELRKIRIKNNL